MSCVPTPPSSPPTAPLETGVRPIDLVNPDQVDILALAELAAADPEAAAPRPAAALTIARCASRSGTPAFPGATGSRALPAFLRDGRTQVDLIGPFGAVRRPLSSATVPTRW